MARAALALTSSDLGADPHRDGTALHPPLENRHSARRGGYRILSRTGYQVITILDVEHRRDVHRR